VQTIEQKFGRFAADFDNVEAFDALFNALAAAGYAVENRTWKNDACPKMGVGSVDIFVEYKDIAMRESEVPEPATYFVFNWADGDDGHYGRNTVDEILEWIATQPLQETQAC
jgi:hypothetical protein